MRRWIRSSRLPVEKYGRPDSADFGSGNTLGWFAPLSTAAQPISVSQIGLPCATQPVGEPSSLAADALVVRVAPPVPDVLDAEHPGLAQAVGDRRARLRGARRIVRVVPVVGVAAAQVSGEIIEIVDRARDLPVEMRGAVAPVGERRVVVDADDVDRRRRPQRIERKAHFARATIHHMRAVLGPVRARR